MVSRRQGPRSRSCLAHGWPVENDEGAEGGRGADLQRWIPSSLKNLGEVCWWRSSAGTLGGFCASATSWSKWHISKASRNQKTSKGEKLPREGTNLVIQSFLLETCTRTMSWYYCTNMTFDFWWFLQEVKKKRLVSFRRAIPIHGRAVWLEVVLEVVLAAKWKAQAPTIRRWPQMRKKRKKDGVRKCAWVQRRPLRAGEVLRSEAVPPGMALYGRLSAKNSLWQKQGWI